MTGGPAWGAAWDRESDWSWTTGEAVAATGTFGVAGTALAMAALEAGITLSISISLMDCESSADGVAAETQRARRGRRETSRYAMVQKGKKEGRGC